MCLRANLSTPPHSSSQGNQLCSGMMRLHSVSLHPISIISATQVARAPDKSFHAFDNVPDHAALKNLDSRGVLCQYLVIWAVGDRVHLFHSSLGACPSIRRILLASEG